MQKVPPIIIIGAGQAGIQVCETLREQDYKGDILLIGKENCLPYKRPPLSKKYIGDSSLDIDRILIRAASFFETNNIKVLTGVEVVEINTTEKNIVTDHEQTFHYSSLVLATGAEFRKLPPSVCPYELYNDKVFSLQTQYDAELVRRSALQSKSAIIIGGGYTGLEAASSLRSMDIDVTLLHSSGRLLSHSVGAEISEYFYNLHLENKVKILTDSYATGISACDKRVTVTTSDNNSLEADFVLVTIGAKPAVRLATTCNIETSERGIIIDEMCRTSVKDIYAAGDCTAFPMESRDIVHIESVQNAIEQGKIVGENIAHGDISSYRALPWFWSDQYDRKLLTAGFKNGFTQTLTTRPSDNAIAVWYFLNNTFIAVDTVNMPQKYALARRILQRTDKCSMDDFIESGYHLIS